MNVSVDRTWNELDYLKTDLGRLGTFANWPVPFMNPQTLAHSGFIYLRYEDVVQCVYCKGIVGSWEEGDIPDIEHRRHFPRCPFMLFDRERLQARGPANDETGIHIIRVLGSVDPDLIELGIYRLNSPRGRHYVTLADRLSSYNLLWHPLFPVKPDQLAEAGFYYAGVTDHVRCFYCGGGLKNWQKDDNPWREHAKWFPHCPFVTLRVGLPFIEKARRGLDVTVPIVNDNPANETLTCKVCLENEIGCAFLPCGHTSTCIICASSLGNCPICRRQINAMLRIYFS